MENKLTNIKKAFPENSIRNELMLAQQSKLLFSCSDEEIKIELMQVLILIGCPVSNYPHDGSKIVLINFLKKNFARLSVDELKLSFEFAITGKFKVEINLFGEPFSAKYIAHVLNIYIAWKKSILKQKKEGMTCNQKFNAIVNILKNKKSETFDIIKQIGSVENHVIKNGHSTELNNKLYKLWFNQFHLIDCKQGASGFIFRYGETMDAIRYCKYKIEQQDRVKGIIENKKK